MSYMVNSPSSVRFLRSLLKKLVKLTPKVNLNDAIAVSQTKELLSHRDLNCIAELLPPVDYCISQQAPVMYGEVFENEDFHASLFGFNAKGDRIPLHDHPRMHGFIKCLRGALRVRSFSFLDRTGKDWSGRSKVRYEGERVVTPHDECLYLESADNNVHEIVGLEDGSFFFDVLVPGYKEHDCTYYTVAKKQPLPEPGEITVLLEFGPHAPHDFFCHDIRFDKILL